MGVPLEFDENSILILKKEIMGFFTEKMAGEVKKNKEITENNTTSLKTFHYLENGKIDFSILETKRSTKLLEAGIYELNTKVENNNYVIDLRVSSDKELFDNDLGFYYEDKVRNIYDKFFQKEIKEKVNTLGYNHKLGILLYGKQGTGKTSMFKKYFNHAVVNYNSIVFNITADGQVSMLWNFIKQIREIQSNPIVVFIDEFEQFLTEKNDHERTFKTLLDGSDSIDNCLFMLTTNYIDKIPKTIKDRPSRIKYSIEVEGIQSEILIEKFLKQSFDKVGLEVDFKNDISKMKGWTIDELKQWVLDKVMDIEPESKNGKKLGF